MYTIYNAMFILKASPEFWGFWAPWCRRARISRPLCNTSLARAVGKAGQNGYT